MKFDRLSRRMFLQGSGKMLLAMPVLPSLLPKAEAATIAAAKRLVCMTTNYGSANFFPDSESANNNFYEFVKNGKEPNMTYTNSSGSVMYRPLSQIQGTLGVVLQNNFDSLRSKINIIRGLHGVDPFMGHQTGFATTASCNWFNGDDRHTVRKPVFPWGIDGIIERSKFGVGKGLRMIPGHSYSTYQYGGNCWNQDDPSGPKLFCYDANSRAFNDFLKGVNINPPATPGVDNAVVTRRLVLNSVFEDYRKVASSRRIASEDKTLFQNYMDIINDLLAGLEKTAPPPASACSVPAESSIDNYTAANNTGSLDYDLMNKNMIAITVASLMCNSTNVAVLHVLSGSPRTYDTNADWHSDAHGEHYGGVAHSRYMERAAYRYKQFQLLLSAMDAVKDVNGMTLLDNSMAYYCSELSHGGHGNGVSNWYKYHMRNMAVITAGSGGGTLSTGNYIDALNRPYNSLLVTFLTAMGLTPTDYERDNKQGVGTAGFGNYSAGPFRTLPSGHSHSYEFDHVKANLDPKYLTDAQKRTPLPLLFKT